MRRTQRTRPLTWGLLAILLFLLGVPFLGCLLFSAPAYRGPTSDHFDGKRFLNAAAPERRGFLAFLRWMFTRRPGTWSPWIDASFGPPPPPRVSGDRWRVTFVNHSTFLLQMEGLNILVDPVWSDRIGPVAWAGPRRHRAPGIRFKDLPPIDIVLITHNHYDHLDLPTLARLAERDHPRLFTGLGNSALLTKRSIAGSTDLDWWDAVDLGGGRALAFVPARHFSSRSQCDRNRTLWGGFVLRTPEGNAYLAGDTGMAPEFGEIRRRFGAPRLAILPIGAYLPRWFMAPMHLSPAEALAAHEELGAATSIASHFGTFQLGDDGQFEAVEELARALRSSPDATPHFWILDPGEGREVPPVSEGL
jgi:L-ascorbate metabolism protein UlaG (beta-lactamase superfamily)